MGTEDGVWGQAANTLPNKVSGKHQGTQPVCQGFKVTDKTELQYL